MTRAEIARTLLDELDRDYRHGLEECPLSDIIVSHNAFGYLADRYDLRMHAIAFSPDEDPPAAALAELVQVAREKDIDVIFTETLASPRVAETIAREVGASTDTLHTLEGLTPDEVADGQGYFAIMRSNLIALQIALDCFDRPF